MGHPLCTSVSLLAFVSFELSVETKQTSPMGLAFHLGYIPPEEYIK